MKHTMQLVRVDRTTDQGWSLLPACLRRIDAFCTKYPTELDAKALLNTVQWDFFTASSALGLWVALDVDSHIVAHLLVRLDEVRRLAFIFQFESDQRLPFPFIRQSLNTVEVWARMIGVRAIEAVTWHNPRLWSRYGFVHHRSVVRRPLDG